MSDARSAPNHPPEDATSAPASASAWRVFVIPALLALAGYVGFYACDARLRSRDGPWEVEFFQDRDGTPALRIMQERLGIQDVQIRFSGERLPEQSGTLPARVRFDQPTTQVPYGTVAFDDLMYLPGTVVLHCFGHEVQLVPRRLYLNRSGMGWTNGARMDLVPGMKLPTLAPPAKAGGRSR